MRLKIGKDREGVQNTGETQYNKILGTIKLCLLYQI